MTQVLAGTPRIHVANLCASTSFSAVGHGYEGFRDTTDDEVREALAHASLSERRGDIMQIGKDHVLEALRAYGTPEQVRTAERALGPHVDTEEDADLLRELGIDPDRRAEGGNLAPAEGPGDEMYRG